MLRRMSEMEFLHPPTNVPLLIRSLPLLQCPQCRSAKVLEWFGDDSLPAHWSTHGAVVCHACATCYRYHKGVLEFLTQRPTRITRAQNSNFSRLVYRNYQKYWRRWILSVLAFRRFSNEEESHRMQGWIQRYARSGPAVDIGTGHGFYAQTLARTCPASPIFAVDFSLGMLYEAHRWAAEHALQDRILFVLADVENLPFRSGMAGIVTCGGGLNEYGNTEVCLREIRRIISDESHFISMHLQRTSGVTGLIQDLAEDVSGLRFPWQSEWNATFLNGSFRIREEFEAGLARWAILH